MSYILFRNISTTNTAVEVDVERTKQSICEDNEHSNRYKKRNILYFIVLVLKTIFIAFFLYHLSKCARNIQIVSQTFHSFKYHIISPLSIPSPNFQ